MHLPLIVGGRRVLTHITIASEASGSHASDAMVSRKRCHGMLTRCNGVRKRLEAIQSLPHVVCKPFEAMSSETRASAQKRRGQKNMITTRQVRQPRFCARNAATIC
jgi:hypothetical protein